MQIALEPDFVVTEAMPVLDSRMRSLGLSENQVSVVMAVRRKGRGSRSIVMLLVMKLMEKRRTLMMITLTIVVMTRTR